MTLLTPVSTHFIEAYNRLGTTKSCSTRSLAKCRLLQRHVMEKDYGRGCMWRFSQWLVLILTCSMQAAPPEQRKIMLLGGMAKHTKKQQQLGACFRAKRTNQKWGRSFTRLENRWWRFYRRDATKFFLFFSVVTLRRNCKCFAFI